MPSFSISGGSSTSFVDTTPGGGVTLDFTSLDNSFSIQINGVQLFVGGPAGAENELQFQTRDTAGQTVRFADGDVYGFNTVDIWALSSSGGPIVQLEILPNGTITLSGIKSNNGSLQPLELFNGMSVNTAAIAAAWNSSGSNTITINQLQTGPTGATGDFVDMVCFASGTLVETANGPIRVEDLRVGEQVLTYDHGYQPIRWIGSSFLSREKLMAQPRLKPIRICANALGAGYPQEDLVVSPQHRVLVSSVIAERMFDCKEVLIPAKKLLPLSDIDVVEDDREGVHYFHILFDMHEIVWSNGTPTESLFTGPEALKSVSEEARREIFDLFPECAMPGFKARSARLIPERGKQMHKLVARHQANNKPIFHEAMCQ